MAMSPPNAVGQSRWTTDVKDVVDAPATVNCRMLAKNK